MEISSESQQQATARRAGSRGPWTHGASAAGRCRRARRSMTRLAMSVPLIRRRRGMPCDIRRVLCTATSEHGVLTL